ncbi:UbiH/UbiF/VisC/COQ6 family ubiquinone biosynthesis hydroxylase [Kordiimonas marina]|uniref:UbiH/UbiF/VisC/COQ6 family ubiquinone biosynthesis hydroxylase n=1 Tax=Kordiimonas marina TaxID=2872312 RepID=UPI001FF5E18F|nr:UbiH/UbiF/VisC/COQ6 family ubiquinone biosynthesis hydroxylase [Kordiimonas marina]MCJ9429843.1 UbiH/UbiF/VisC/COQ6 family ubiquinone biosynthesis hydroxylase [Kordiimonas marina]
MARTSGKHDITIIGGGLGGMTAAIGLAQQGFKVAVIDRAPKGDLTAAAYDGRASALAFATCRMLDALGIWQYMEPYAQPILEIRVTDGPSLMHLHFDNESLGEGPLGHMVENRHTRLALFKRLEDVDGITLYAPDTVTEIVRTPEMTNVTLASGTEITSPLLLGMDGRASMVRAHAGIGVDHFSYKQHGIVCSIEHEFSHCGIAHERFLASGPFAILPLTGNRSSLVWTEKEHLVPTIMKLSDRAFEAEVKRRVGDFLGEVKVIGGRWSYPLTLQYANRYTDTRMALLGDAAHGIHPIAGQGLNLGLRDVAAMVEVLTDAARAGLDIGAPDVLDRYAQWRHTDNTTLYAVTDILNRLFSNDIGPMRLARDIGLAVVNEIPPLKNFFMAHARGTVGELPKLLQGQMPGA